MIHSPGRPAVSRAESRSMPTAWVPKYTMLFRDISDRTYWLKVLIRDVTLSTLDTEMVCFTRAVRNARWVAERPMSALG